MDLLIIFGVILGGFALILLDILVIPGGIVGTIGGLIIIGTIGIVYNNFSAELAIWLSAFSIAVAFLIVYITIRFKLLKKFVLDKSETKAEGFDSHNPILNELLNTVGITDTILRPSGTIKIANKRYDAITNGDFIQKGVTVKVIDISTGQLLVKKENVVKEEDIQETNIIE